jgi:hypothetical protein
MALLSNGRLRHKIVSRAKIEINENIASLGLGYRIVACKKEKTENMASNMASLGLRYRMVACGKKSLRN